MLIVVQILCTTKLWAHRVGKGGRSSRCAYISWELWVLANGCVVLLQAMKNDPPADHKCRDKFLVQSVAITADREANNVQQIV